MKKNAIILLAISLTAIYTLLFLLFIKEEWQEKEILNIVFQGTGFITPEPGRDYAVSVFEDGSLHAAIGWHSREPWRNSLFLGDYLKKSPTDLNRRGYWQIIWRGSVQLAQIDGEIQIQLSEEDFGRIKSLISAIDGNRLSRTDLMAYYTTHFLVNTRRTRYYAQDNGLEDERIMALYYEIMRHVPFGLDSEFMQLVLEQD